MSQFWLLCVRAYLIFAVVSDMTEAKPYVERNCPNLMQRFSWSGPYMKLIYTLSDTHRCELFPIIGRNDGGHKCLI